MNETNSIVAGEFLDPSAVNAQLEKHHAASFGWALGCCRHNRTEAEDVLQSAYVKILNGQARYDGRAAFRTWLFAVIRKTAIDAHRRTIFRRWWLARAEKSGDVTAAAQDRTSPDLPAEQVLFQQALAALPARQREVLHLVFYQQMSVQQAADVMGVSVGSARTHYERGKRRLRAQISASPLFHESRLLRPDARPAF